MYDHMLYGDQRHQIKLALREFAREAKVPFGAVFSSSGIVPLEHNAAQMCIGHAREALIGSLAESPDFDQRVETCLDQWRQLSEKAQRDIHENRAEGNRRRCTDMQLKNAPIDIRRKTAADNAEALNLKNDILALAKTCGISEHRLFPRDSASKPLWLSGNIERGVERVSRAFEGKANETQQAELDRLLDAWKQLAAQAQSYRGC